MVCTYLPTKIGIASLSYNTYLGRYMHVSDSWVGTCGVYFALSSDMVNWSSKQMIAPTRLPGKPDY